MEKLFNNICAIAVKSMLFLAPVLLVSGLLSLIGFESIEIVIALVLLILALLMVAHRRGWWSVSAGRQGECQDCHKEGKMAVAGGVSYCMKCGKMHL